VGQVGEGGGHIVHHLVREGSAARRDDVHHAGGGDISRRAGLENIVMQPGRDADAVGDDGDDQHGGDDAHFAQVLFRRDEFLFDKGDGGLFRGGWIGGGSAHLASLMSSLATNIWRVWGSSLTSSSCNRPSDTTARSHESTSSWPFSSWRISAMSSIICSMA